MTPEEIRALSDEDLKALAFSNNVEEASPEEKVTGFTQIWMPGVARLLSGPGAVENVNEVITPFALPYEDKDYVRRRFDQVFKDHVPTDLIIVGWDILPLDRTDFEVLLELLRRERIEQDKLQGDTERVIEEAKNTRKLFGG